MTTSDTSNPPEGEPNVYVSKSGGGVASSIPPPGKAALGLRVIRRKSREIPGYWRMLARGVPARWVSAVVFCLGYFWALWGEDNQTWHDKMVDTLVVEKTSDAA